ncbi:MAG TPA: TIGR04283 family arsenosugar biosynthesis glycosyltransferase [Sulfuricaulis sp.]|nr:TIGR04283 family arsenosugar biosynthesis glycosyltransferase [Sulfuricaulis sp.]
MATPAPVSSPVTVAVILPVLNEAQQLEPALSDLTVNRQFDEIIVVDGGSTDAGVEIVCKYMTGGAPDRHTTPVLIQSARGRALQMHAGAQAAEADVLLFLHADCELPPGAADDVRDAIEAGRLWGRFDARLSGGHFLLRVIERLMNWRSRLTGIATGDQAMFVRRDVYRLLGGFAPLPLMEDVEFSARLKGLGRPACLPGPVVASSRRWEKHGIVRTVLLMWTLRFLYWLGVSPARLARWYYRS